MKKITGIVLLVMTLSNRAQALTPAEVIASGAQLAGQTISVSGRITRIQKDGMSSKTVIVELTGGLQVRTEIDAYKIGNETIQIRPVNGGACELWRSRHTRGPIEVYGSSSYRSIYPAAQIFRTGDAVALDGAVVREQTRVVINSIGPIRPAGME